MTRAMRARHVGPVAGLMLSVATAAFAADDGAPSRPARAAETSVASAAGTDAAPDSSRARSLDDVLSSLRGRTERVLSPESRALDIAFRDSVSAVYDSTVAADGLPGTLGRHAAAREWRGRGGVRTGLTISPEDSRIDYTKVDGLSAAVAGYGYLTALGVRSRTGGRIGYAFGSGRGRHDAGVRLSARGISLGVAHREVTESFGWTAVHGWRLFALAGADELDYLERDGWRAVLELPRVLPEALTTRVTYRREDELARRVRDYFTIGERSALFESNPQATEGEVRAVGLAIGRSRLDYPDLYGSLVAETAGRGLGGDLSYDLVRVRGALVHRLPWADQLSLEIGAQATAAPRGEIPVQALADPSGRSGVRGYPHRSLVGSHALLARVEYRVAKDLFRAARIPLLRRAKLQLVPFVDVGAAWTPSGPTELSATTLPEGGDWRWGTGLGVRRNVGFGEIISHFRLDGAVRLDRTGAAPVFYFVLEGEPFD